MVALIEFFGEILRAVGKYIIYCIFEIVPCVFNFLKHRIDKVSNKAVRLILTIFAVPVSIVLTISIPIAVVFGIILTVNTVDNRNVGIKNISFNDNDSVKLVIDDTENKSFFSSVFKGKEEQSGHFLVDFKGNQKQQEKAKVKFTIEDIELVVADPNIAVVSLEAPNKITNAFFELFNNSNAIKVNYKIVALSEGETIFYIQSSDKKVKSEEIIITVN